MKLKAFCYLLCALGLHILPTFGQVPAVVIRLSHPTDKNYTILHFGYNRATIGVLTQNVTLQTNNITGIWQRPDNTNTTDNKIEFPPFTANFAGLYRFYRTNQNESYVLAIQIVISVSGTNFAQVSSQGDYTILSGNNIFNTTTSLVCATNDTSQQIQWTHQSNLDASTTNVSTSTWSNVTGISRLEIVMTAHGYYTCTPIPGGTSYRVGIFNPDITLVAQQGGNYVYTKGTDPSDIQFLCVSTDTNIALNEVIWDLTPFNQNPINLNSLPNMNSTLMCNLGSSSTLEVTLLVQGLPTISLSNTTQGSFSARPQGSNTANIRVLTDNVILQTELEGRWETPGNVSTTDKSISFPYFTADHAGLYRFYVAGWDSNEVLAIQILISATGTNFAQVTSPGDYAILSGNNIFNTTTSLVCATNDTSQEIQWTRQSNLDASSTSVTSTWDDVTGISTLEIVITAHGYYTCTPIPGGTSYRVGIFNPDFTLVAQQGGTYVYTKGTDPSDIQFLCVSTDTSIALNEVIWILTPLNQNPINLNSLANMNSPLICNLGSSSTLEVTLLVQGPPTISLSNTTQGTFSARPQGNNTANIRVLTDNVILQTELGGRWVAPGNVSITDKSIVFPYFTVDHAGLYRFYVAGWNSIEVLAIEIIISASGSNFAEETSPGVYIILSGNNVFFTVKKLVCATNDSSQQVKWFYRRTQDSDPIDLSGVAKWNSTSGLSKLNITESENGYFTCEIQTGSSSYSAAKFEKEITIIATNQISIVYTKPIDPNNIQLLCTTTDSSTSLYEIRWNVTTSDNNNENPIILNSLDNNEYILNCNGGTTSSSFNVNLLIQGPPTITLSNTTHGTFSTLQPNSNTAAIRVLTQNVTLLINLIGMWQTPKNSSISDNSISYSIFTADLAGLYTFYVNNWKDIQEMAITITISAAGSNFAEKLSSGGYRLLSGNNIFYTDRILVCVTSNTSQEIQWTYQPTQDATNIPRTDATWKIVTGISELSITTAEQGYYTCEIMSGGTNYTVAIFNPDITIVASGLFFSYIKGIDPTNIQLLCDPYDTTVTLSSIRLEYSGSQFNNPLILNEAGSIDDVVNCVFGSSQLPFSLIIREPSLRVTYTEYTMEYNTLSPSTTPLTIPLFSTDVRLYINNIASGTWNLPRNISGGRSLEIPNFILVSTGRYTFNSTQTWDGVAREVFRIDISPTGDALAIIDSVGGYEPKDNNPFFYTDTALVCLTDYNTEVKWFYRIRSQANKQDITTPTTDVNGISTYTAVISQPGFYICEGMKYGSAYTYTAGVFNATDTRVAEEGASYFYTIRIDREGSELLCDPMDSSVDLNTVDWFRKDVHTNPLDFNENIHRIAHGAGEIKCFVSTLTDIRLTANLTIQARPVVKVDYLENTTSLTLYQSAPIYIPLLINNTVISTNLINGIWRFKYSDGNTESGSNTEYNVDLFTANNIGVYRYVFKNFFGGGEILVVTLGGTGSGFGMESGSKITTISNNTIFYQDTLTLVAASNKIPLESNDIIWTQQDAINDSDISNISEAIIDTTLSTSKLNLDTLLNGYYTVIVKDNNSTTEQYVVGVFKTENIHDTRGVKSINYTSGVDSEELQILCIPSTYPILANVRWVINGSLNFSNPVKLEEIAQKFGETKNTTLMCLDITTNDTVYERIQITIKEPPSIIITYFNESIASVGTPDQNTFDIKIQVFTQNVQFECNKPECRWNTGSTFGSRMQISDETDFTIPYITIQNNIPYNLLTKDSSGVFVPSVSITIIPIGTAFQRLIKNGSREVYQTVTTNSIINLEENTTLACVTSYVNVTEQDIQWFYQDIDLNQVVAIAGQFNSTTGLSVLTVNKTGYFTCQVPDESKSQFNYTVGIIEISNETMEISLSDLQSTKEVDFVLGQPLKLFFQSINISVQAIRWGIASVGDDSSFPREYLNPVDVNEVFNKIGSGAFKFTCFYRQSPITTVGALGLNLRDTASLMLQYGQVMDNFSDESNNDFPEPEDIRIPIVTKDVSISCSLSSCAGLILMNEMVLTELSIESLRIENQGIYALKRSSGTGFEYTTASFKLIVTGYMEQNITSLNTNIINDTSVSIIWELQNQLPDNAMETFNITYNASGGTIMMAEITTDLTYNLTDLISGETYTIYVELSYAYTFKTFKKSVEVTIPEASPPFPILRLIPAFVFVIVAIITVIVVILIICIVRQRRKKGKKFQTLQDDERTTPESTKNRLNQGYAPLSTPLENPIFNPDLTESILEKSKFIESVQSKSEHYQNLQDINDPRLKPIPLDLFKKTMDKLWENEQTLEEEYKSLGGEMLRYECRHAQMDQNRIKNKYKFIYPYDKSRVVLTKLGKDPNSDYINASYIPGLYVTENFVASQGPKENTIQDLWRMVLEKKILNVVMVTNCVEGGKLKCEEYFPLKEGKTVEYGPYKVKNAFTQHSTGHITRTLNITSDRESVQVKHFHFTAWPDHDVPSLFDELLTFIGFVQGNITQSEAPILVHCSAGVGRTGTFITLFNLRSAIQKKQPICVYQLVNEMREHRPHMVQTFRQYKFIYLAVLELLLDKTSIPADEFTSTYRTYLKSDQEGYVSVFFQQFSELNYQCEKSFIFSCSEGKNNEHKNPDHNVLPFDNNRVVIFSPHFKANYINASYHENNLFITTQNPIANTVCDFLQMIYQTEATLVVMLTTAKEKSKISANMSDRKPYWPNKDASLSVPPFQVEIVSSEKSTAVIKQKVTLRNLKDDSEHTFMHVVSTTWNDKCDPTDLQSVVTLLKLILKYRQEYPNKHIIMHCADSITKTGIVFIVYQCIREMQETGAVDLFHTIKRLRRERMNIMPDLSNFLSCFALMNEYCSST